MARISGVDLPRSKRVEIGLTYIYGIGRSRAREICSQAAADVNKRVEALGEDEVQRLRRTIDQKYKVEGDLRCEVTLNVKRYVDLGCYRGLRHRRNLPVHGQRTHTNARTRKGPRRAIAGKKAAPPKG